MKRVVCGKCAGNGYEYSDSVLGAQLREWREKCGMVESDCANLLGISQTYLSLLERGKRRWTPEILRRTRQMLSPKRNRKHEKETNSRKK